MNASTSAEVPKVCGKNFVLTFVGALETNNLVLHDQTGALPTALCEGSRHIHMQQSHIGKLLSSLCFIDTQCLLLAQSWDP